MSETPTQRDAQRLLAAVSGALTEHGMPAPGERARERARLTLAACVDEPLLAVAPLAASALLDAIAVDPVPETDRLRALRDDLAALGVAPLALAREALRAPSISSLEPAAARTVLLKVLLVCAPVHHISVWSRTGIGAGAGCSAHAGPGGPSAASRRLARTTLAGGTAAQAGEMCASPVLRAGQPVGALVARAVRGSNRRVAAFLAEAQGPLTAIEEREALLASNAASERMLLGASERRLTRLGYDLHDGPLQELLLVGEDLALFRRQLAVVLEGRRGNELLGGRLDDLHARLSALEAGLRRISSSVHSDVLVTRPFGEALRDLIEPFAARSGIEPELQCEGDLESISTSQRLAVLSVVGEALNNAREHGEASAVSVRIRADRRGLLAQVRDDGRGFDVERELLRAARSGHMGLAGMHERVRLLDGHCRVESNPGGPTEVTLALPVWGAPASAAVPAAASATG